MRPHSASCPIYLQTSPCTPRHCLDSYICQASQFFHHIYHVIKKYSCFLKNYKKSLKWLRARRKPSCLAICLKVTLQGKYPCKKLWEHGRMLKCSSKFSNWKKNPFNVVCVKANNEMRNSTEQKNAEYIREAGRRKRKKG